MYAHTVIASTALRLVSTDSAEILAEQTLSPDPIQRYYAAKTMASLGPVDCAFVPALHRLLRDEEFNVRLVACDALSVMGSDALPAVTGLCHLLQDKTIGVRQSAAHALQALSPLPPSSHHFLTAALTDPNPKVREHAAAALAMSQPNDLHTAA